MSFLARRLLLLQQLLLLLLLLLLLAVIVVAIVLVRLVNVYVTLPVLLLLQRCYNDGNAGDDVANDSATVLLPP